jgi:hypothetical protein
MMHATQIKHKELVEVLVVVLRGFAPRIIWKQVGVVDGSTGPGTRTLYPHPAESCQEFGGSAAAAGRLLHRPPHPHLLGEDWL